MENRKKFSFIIVKNKNINFYIIGKQKVHKKKFILKGKKQI
jgi:hypothetical protein